ncbi:hypothetical protein CfE428DRAFT_0761 [Chthoniobacter flavus Ellin428]|uniref:Glycosyltransferase RgtA/B/C/D-like domain-containing protein n=1 Tax=Chthoniobacter flavus Ellin428 TaxID=497964 RepID=B4CVS4_9BACT|nr:hypothetical protein [Chthoniobacter flavus]EDY21516.1 hypothetical protein CfE428DRAFT_0761 [Chthoniobacter flavus Ellin428]TCO95466.1 4-amino-4-deoxy-L-arabinose transferase-like glycosyltransferase [Chthoniobacter flavus]
MNFKIRTCWPLVTSLFIYWAAVAILVFLATGMNGGHFVYPLDDTYIHMSIAKSTATSGIWGVTPYAFTSSTSSPFWTFLLAVTYLVFGIHDSAALILALICGSLLIGAIYVTLARYLKSPGRIFLSLLILIFVTPLPSLTFTGMEHVLHILLFTVFLFLAIPLLLARNKPTFKEAQSTLIVAPFLVVTRYESLFLAFVICAILFFQRKILLSVILGAVSLFPAVIYGAWSAANGWYWLPNSVLLKGHRPHLSLSVSSILNQFGGGALDVIEANPHILLLVIFSLLVILRYPPRENRGQNDIRWAHIVFLGCVLLHMQFAGMGWFFRYDAYLVFMGLALVAISVNELLPESWIGILKEKGLLAAGVLTLFVVVVGIPFYNRASVALEITPWASKNIYEQQYQMASFLRRYYPDGRVAANDIGAITYFTNIRLVDLVGLGTMETAKWRLNQSLTTQRVDLLTQRRGVSLALVYDSWFTAPNGRSSLPPSWVKVAEWKITHNVVCGGDTVSIFATSAQGVEALKGNLRKFASEMPSDVQQAGPYLQAPNQ